VKGKINKLLLSLLKKERRIIYLVTQNRLDNGMSLEKKCPHCWGTGLPYRLHKEKGS
jgi:hypothetical protein